MGAHLPTSMLGPHLLHQSCGRTQVFPGRLSSSSNFTVSMVTASPWMSPNLPAPPHIVSGGGQRGLCPDPGVSQSCSRRLAPSSPSPSRVSHQCTTQRPTETSRRCTQALALWAFLEPTWHIELVRIPGPDLLALHPLYPRSCPLPGAFLQIAQDPCSMAHTSPGRHCSPFTSPWKGLPSNPILGAICPGACLHRPQGRCLVVCTGEHVQLPADILSRCGQAATASHQGRP